jgi:cysteinyl-tRNA synthetase
LQRFPGEALRLALIKGRYREPISWSDDLVQQAKSQLDRLYGALERLAGIDAAPGAPPATFTDAMDDDLNTPLAIAHLMALAGAANTATDPGEQSRLKAEILACGGELGILGQTPSAWFSSAQPAQVDAAEVESLIEARRAARAGKDWKTADLVRDKLTAMGVVLMDGPQGTTWRVE